MFWKLMERHNAKCEEDKQHSRYSSDHRASEMPPRPLNARRAVP